jgi:UDP-2,3-diacylglucosamine pyrophosphatase LpxH
MQTNLLVVSDLHFGEDLLPGASVEKRRAVALGASAFCDFLRHHAQRRLDGKPWQLVVAGDLFDFMAVTLDSSRGLPARNRDERWAGRTRSTQTGAARMREIGAAHRAVLAAMVRFAAAGNQIDLVVGNHDLELLEEETAAELRRQLLEAGRNGNAARPLAAHGLARGDAERALEAAVERIRVRPWFVYLPGVAWIEHGHVYDEACSFEFNQAPFDPKSGELYANVDNAAVRYLAQAAPELDPHGTEEWGFTGYLRYAIGRGAGSFCRLISGYVRFTAALLDARRRHRSARLRRARHELHRRRLVAIAERERVELSSLLAIDRLARAPVTKSARRLFAMLMLDRWMSLLGGGALSLAALALLPLGQALLVLAAVIAGIALMARRSAASMVGSQVPMLAVPERIRKIVDAPVVVFGHTHDPRRLPLAGGGAYLNTGTWLPASRPGLLRSFTHVLIRDAGAGPAAEIRQWRDGRSARFDDSPVIAPSSPPMLPALRTPSPWITPSRLSPSPASSVATVAASMAASVAASTSAMALAPPSHTSFTSFASGPEVPSIAAPVSGAAVTSLASASDSAPVTPPQAPPFRIVS